MTASINKIINAIQKKAKIPLVSVRFKGSSKVYHYKTWYGFHKEDTYVVVNTPSNGMTIAKVVSDELESIDLSVGWRYKWIVSKINTSSWEQMCDMDDQIQSELIFSQEQKEMDEIMEGIDPGIVKKYTAQIPQ